MCLSAMGLAKSFGDNLVFVDVEFAVERGERMLLIGLNGAGKTTLLRILAGVGPRIWARCRWGTTPASGTTPRSTSRSNLGALCSITCDRMAT